ncbi:hypothetical protein [Enterococcus termitis]|nr:hypothetical protein [Enterococcus termitis]OJG97211.1 hypothetical protein RV18_GL001076 [Enterococcus termitis]
MKINDKDIKEIIVTDSEGNLLASLNDDNLITHDSINVELVEFKKLI